MRRILLTALILWAGPAGFVWAEDADDGPGRGVARISVINGDVSVRRGDSGEWVAAAINAPLVVADHIFVGAGSRAEVQFDYANMIRIGHNSEVRFAELEHRRYQLQIAKGTTTFRVLRDSDAEVELSTPSVSVRPVKKGTYRIIVRDDGASEITVRSGEAEVFTPRGVERMRSGKTMLARGTASDPEFQIVSEIASDEWDNWNERRDRDLQRSRSYQYVSRDIYGAEDLDSYGRWVYVPPYGWVWSPYVSDGWVPYRYGRWSWVDWYGWNWVSYDPWGWAPYHYGRWFHHGPYGWCWYPGSIYDRHYYRPALVAFFGWGGHSGFRVGFGIGFGRVGWVPLAPYEPYYPWYGHHYYRGYRNGTYIDNSVRVVNNVNITNIYRNSRVNNAVTAVDGSDFGRGRVGNIVRVSDTDVRRASAVRGPVPVVPQTESLRLADRQVRTAGLPSSTREGRFFSRNEPRQAERVSFQDQQRGMEQISRRAFGAEGSRGAAQVAGRRADVESGRESRAVSRVGSDSDSGRGWPRAGESVRSEPARTSSEGWRRFGEPARAESRGVGVGDAGRGTVRSRGDDSPRGVIGRSSDSESGGWRRFGEPTRVYGGAAESRGEQRVERGTGRANDSAIEQRGSDSGWRRFGTERFEGRGDISRSPRDSSSPRYESPRFGTSPSDGPRFESPSRRDSGEPVRIRPPMIRERAEPRSEGFGRSSGGSFGGGGSAIGRSADRMESRGSVRSGGGPSMRSGGGGPSVRSGGGGGPSVRSGGGGGRSSGGGRSGRSR